MKIKVGDRIVVRNRLMVIEAIENTGECTVSDEDGLEYVITENLIDRVFEDNAVYDD